MRLVHQVKVLITKLDDTNHVNKKTNPKFSSDLHICSKGCKHWFNVFKCIYSIHFGEIMEEEINLKLNLTNIGKR